MRQLKGGGGAGGMHSYETSGVWGLGNHMYMRQTGCGERASNKNMNSWTPKDWLVSVTVCCERIQLIVNCDVTFRNNQPQFNPSVPRTYSSKQTKCYFPWTSGGGDIPFNNRSPQHAAWSHQLQTIKVSPDQGAASSC